MENCECGNKVTSNVGLYLCSECEDKYVYVCEGCDAYHDKRRFPKIKALDHYFCDQHFDKFFHFVGSCYTFGPYIREPYWNDNSAWRWFKFHKPTNEQIDISIINNILETNNWTVDQLPKLLETHKQNEDRWIAEKCKKRKLDETDGQENDEEREHKKPKV